MFAEPLRVARFIELMVGEIEYGDDNLALLGDNVIAVLSQENEACQKSGALVPVDKAVISRKTGRVRGSQVKQIRLPACE